MSTDLFDPLFKFLTKLEDLDKTGLHDAFVDEFMETCVDVLDPAKQRKRASHMFEISLHGIHATGASDVETLQNWLHIANTIRDWSRRAESAEFWLQADEDRAIKASRRRTRSRIAAALVLILIAFATVALGHASTKAIANLAHMQAQKNTNLP